MKTQNSFFTKTLLLLLLPLMFACSKDNDNDEMVITPPSIDYTISDLEATIVENPGDATVLGTLTTDLPGTLIFTTDNAAFGFDVSTLEVLVADATTFDYELNTTVSGSITLTNGDESVTASITITLTDFVDAIEAILTTSKTAYSTASQGAWVEVSISEFEALGNELEEVGYSGTTIDEYIFDDGSIGTSLGNNDTMGFTLANVSDATLEEGSYLFGLRFFVGTGVFGVCEGNKVKLSETSSSVGYTDIGNPLPEKISTEREVFFVLKGNVTATTNTGHLGLYFAPTNGATIKESSGLTHFEGGDRSEFVIEPNQGWTYAYQGLSTTKLQWE
ncbi:MAG: hypothetical protein ACR2MT_01270 [Aurantibacter sp.]